MRGVRKRSRAASLMKRRMAKRPRGVQWQRRGRFANGGELKFHDIAIDLAPVLTAGSILNAGTVNIIAQGVLENQRIGRKCTIRKINWRYQIVLPNTASASETADTVRLIFFVDKQTNGLTATVGNILASANFQAFRALENSGRFIILMDKTHKINTQGGIGGATLLFAENQQNYVFNKTVNIPLEFDNSFSDGRLTTIRTNNFGVLAISQGAHAGLDSQLRLRFSDN